MKKIVSIVLSLVMLLSYSYTTLAEEDIKVVVGGEILITDVAPIITDGRTMLPVRAVFEAIGAEVEWIGEEQKVIATKKDKTVEFVINSNVMKINGAEKTIDVPAMIVDGRTLVPVRACAEAFDLKVEWNGETRTVIIKKIISVISEEFTPITEQVGQTWKYTYDSEGKCITRGHDSGLSATLEYDKNGNLVKVTNTTATTNEPIISISNYTYDSNGKCILESDQFGWKKYTYDEQGNVKSWTNSNGVTCEYTYDENNRLAMEFYSHGMWIKYEYNDKSQLIQKTNDDNSKTVYTYDDNNNLKTETGYDEKNAETYKATYEYNTENNLIFVSSTNGYWAKYIQIEI